MSVEDFLTHCIPAAPALAGVVALGCDLAGRMRTARRAMMTGCLLGGAAALFALLLMMTGVWQSPGPVAWWQWLPDTLAVADGGMLTAELNVFAAGFTGALMLSAAVWLHRRPRAVGRGTIDHRSRPAFAFFIATTALLVLAHDFLSLLLFWQISSTAAWAVASTNPDSARAARQLWCLQRVLDLPLVIAVIAMGLRLESWSFAALAGTTAADLIPVATVLLVGITLVSPILASYAAGAGPKGSPGRTHPPIRKTGASQSLQSRPPQRNTHTQNAIARLLFAAARGIDWVVCRPLKGVAWLVQQIDRGLTAAQSGRFAARLLRRLAAAGEPVRRAPLPFYPLALVLGTAVLALLLLRGAP